MDNNEYLEKFRRCINEYTNTSSSFDLTEDGDEDMEGGDPNAMGAAPGGDPNAMGGDPNAMGGDPNAMGGDPNADPNAMGGDPNADPNAMGGGSGPEGFNPQGVDPNAGIEGMGSGPNADPNAMGGDPNAMGGAEGDVPMDANAQGNGDDEEVISVEDLTKSQKAAEKKIDAMSDKFERLMGAVETLVKQQKEMEEKSKDAVAKMADEIEKRNPTPLQRMTMRSTKSAPYSMTPNEYVNNYMPDNYSAADDENGVGDPQYQITKDDIDRFTDYDSIARDLDVEHQGLHDILGM